MNARTYASHRLPLALRFSLLALLVTVGSTLTVFGGCALNTHGVKPDDAGAARPCASDADCNDDNPCTNDSCGSDKLCVFDSIESGPAPDKGQTAGDCKTIVCAGGEPTDQLDPKDFPDDHEDCTVDACDQGSPSHVAKADGTTCTTKDGDPGTCFSGKCGVACGPTMPCPDPGPCATVNCDAASGMCVKEPLQDGITTPGYTDTPGDCQTRVCAGGVDTAAPDDSDLPAVGDCDIAQCNNGQPAPAHKAQHITCMSYMGAQPGYCDGSGHCVQCAEDADCPGVVDDCQHPHCDAATFACSTAFTPAGTPTTANPPQIAGDCQQVQCDGAGHAVTNFFMNDPADDANPCTKDVCLSANNTQHQALANGAACGNGLTCNNNVCNGCSTDAQCVPASCSGTTLTKSQTCDGTGNCVSHGTVNCAPYLCNAGANGCTTSCNTDNDCAVGNYCTGANGQCMPKVPQGGACTATHQCAVGSNVCVDGVCCNSACNGTCVSCIGTKTGGATGTCAPITIGTDPDSECADQGATSCGTNGKCDGTGACQKYSSATQCAPSSCSGTALTLAKFCNGSGTCVTPTPSTTDCAPGSCGGSPAACNNSCSNDGNCVSTGFCGGGMCQTKKTAGATCPTGAHECQSNFCVDGFCCNSACNTACQACAAAKKNTGSDGVCGAAKDGVADPRMMCMSTSQSTCGTDGLCNGGACEDWPSGTACTTASCSGGTLTSAKACDGSGSCVASGMSAPCPGHYACANGTSCRTTCAANGDCVTGFACASGSCLIANGKPCSSDASCASGACGVNGTGNCCTAACNTMGPCAATSCSTTGACVGPGNTTSCATCDVATSTYTSGTCAGNGTCSAGGPAPCPGGYACQDATQCYTSCGTGAGADNSKCASGKTCNSANGKCM